jgi:hypothetical protein
VATGMKMGRGTGPWGRWSVAARALVTYSRGGEMTGRTIKRDVFVEMPTEHFPSSSNESAEGIDAGAMGGGWCYCESTMYVRLYCAASCLVQKLMQMQMQGSKIRCGLCAELASSFLPPSLFSHLQQDNSTAALNHLSTCLFRFHILQCNAL